MKLVSSHARGAQRRWKGVARAGKAETFPKGASRDLTQALGEGDKIPPGVGQDTAV